MLYHPTWSLPFSGEMILLCIAICMRKWKFSLNSNSFFAVLYVKIDMIHLSSCVMMVYSPSIMGFECERCMYDPSAES